MRCCRPRVVNKLVMELRANPVELRMRWQPTLCERAHANTMWRYIDFFIGS